MSQHCAGEWASHFPDRYLNVSKCFSSIVGWALHNFSNLQKTSKILPSWLRQTLHYSTSWLSTKSKILNTWMLFISLHITLFVLSRLFLFIFRYSVMAGTPDKMLEHILETRIDSKVDETDTFIEDFLLTHMVFMPSRQLCPQLLNQYPLLDMTKRKSHYFRNCCFITIIT